MANLEFKYSSAPLREIKEVQFGLLSPEEIKNMSVVHVEYPETMDETRMRPRELGLSDPKLGSIDRALKCATCDEGQSECPGHFGHIELATPVFHIGRLPTWTASEWYSSLTCASQASLRKSRRFLRWCATTVARSWPMRLVISRRWHYF